MTGGRRGDAADILLVEDNPGDVRLTREAFERGNISNELHVVTDGAEALDFCYRRGAYEDAPRPHLVLLDLNLPKVDGTEVLERLKGDPDLKSIPVVVLTSSEAETDVVESYELHTNAYLTKPIDPDEFVDLVRTFEDFWLTLVKLPPREGGDR
ncbi:response regulator [Halogeometricum limi]|uniref:Response regulator receiver domain-containing protein n=1 Tax=Halogeometricum limi TaxID=555875 RepID=A0A1I6FQX2_9EURY|nr:response regulator [Halogeometricum limi]SFR32350.1 Response regulator receiver domain-containing protein [Halogeometricum limi]